MLYRKHERIVSILIGAAIMGAILTGTIVYFEGFRIKNVADKTKRDTILEIEQRNKGDNEYENVVVASQAITQGEVVGISKTAIIKAPVNCIPDDSVKFREELDKKLTRINISKGTVLSNSMLIDYEKVVTPDLRKQDYFNIKKFYSLKNGDIVDIRIKRRNGSDDIVAAKKEITDIVDSMVCFDVKEAERHNLNYASVEALVSEAEIYTTLYVDPNNQPAAEVTFIPDSKVLSIVTGNPDIVSEAKRELSERIKQENKTDQERNAKSGGANDSSNESSSSGVDNKDADKRVNTQSGSTGNSNFWKKVE